jgi:hypothetical protein
VFDEAGNPTDRFLFNMPGGSIKIIDSSGKQYRATSVSKNAAGDYTIAKSDMIDDGSAPRTSYTDLIASRTEKDIQGISGDSFLERNAMLNRAVANDLRVAEAEANAAANAIDPRERQAVLDSLSTLGAQANGLEADAIATVTASSTNGTVDNANRAKIATLVGTQQEQAFWQTGQYTKYKETYPGSNIWVMKPEYVNLPNSATVAAGAGVGAASAAPIGLPLGAGGAGIAALVGGAIGGVATGLGEFFNSTPIEQRSLDFRTPEQKANDLAAGSKISAPQIAAYQQTGYNTAGVPGSTFFRNLTQPTVVPLTGPAANPYMQLQATVTPGTVPTVKVPSVTPVKLQGVAGDSMAERRARVLANPLLAVKPLATPQPLPKPVRGGV